jgi:hypothetical protein
MRKLLISIVPFLAFAMGGQPKLNEIIPAKLIDKEGKVHKVATLICDDKTYFQFKDGTVTVKVPFSKIKSLKVEGNSGDYLKVEVEFVNGKRKEFLIDPDVDCVGTTSYGTLEAYLSQLKEIDFEPHKAVNR